MAYFTQTNAKTEQYNMTIIERFIHCVNVKEHQSDWDKFDETLIYAYTSQVQSGPLR